MTVVSIDRRDLTAIPHAKCTCGHTDDMHYAHNQEELDALRADDKDSDIGLNHGAGCKMLTHGHDEKGRATPSERCPCRKFEA